MTAITSSTTFSVADGSTATASASVTVIAAPIAGSGKGRLIHPSLGTYDYERPPDEWVNLRGDVVIPPVWATTKTLKGAANTLFVGDIRDVIVQEKWTQGVVGTTSFINALLSFWMNPPDPSVAYVQWYPNYASSNGFNVVMLDFTLGGEEVTTSSLSHQGFDKGAMVLKMRIAGRL